jgi:hypothetical protein
MTRHLTDTRHNPYRLWRSKVVVKTQRRILWGLFWITIKKETK